MMLRKLEDALNSMFNDYLEYCKKYKITIPKIIRGVGINISDDYKKQTHILVFDLLGFSGLGERQNLQEDIRGDSRELGVDLFVALVGIGKTVKESVGAAYDLYGNFRGFLEDNLLDFTYKNLHLVGTFPDTLNVDGLTIINDVERMQYALSTQFKFKFYIKE